MLFAISEVRWLKHFIINDHGSKARRVTCPDLPLAMCRLYGHSAGINLRWGDTLATKGAWAEGHLRFHLAHEPPDRRLGCNLDVLSVTITSCITGLSMLLYAYGVGPTLTSNSRSAIEFASAWKVPTYP